jgi:hypothetical protein
VLAATPGGGWTLTSKDKSSYGFDANGGLISIVDKYGRALDLGYGVDGLETITDPASDRAITLDYTGSRVTSVTTSSVTGTGYSGPLTWNYVYDGDLLTKVCDARDNNVSTGTCTAYSYTSDRLTEIVKPEGNTKRSASYGANGKVSWVENGTDDRYAFTYGAGITQITVRAITSPLTSTTRTTARRASSIPHSASRPTPMTTRASVPRSSTLPVAPNR